MELLDYLAGYPEELVLAAGRGLADGSLARGLAARYPGRHEVRSHAALYRLAQELKQRHLRRAPPLSKVLFDDHLTAREFALGLNSRLARVQGGRLATKREIRIAGLFRDLAPEFLHMVLVHELAHLKEFDHSPAFYRLCRAMEPDYDQLEFDLRLVLYLQEYGAGPQIGGNGPEGPGVP
jgi:predicted metal-dependent hydrolase